MDITQTIATDLYTVELFVHHGNYQATFVGTGATAMEAAEVAANQTSYASGLFDQNDSYYEERAVLRRALKVAIMTGRTYSGFGWNTFKLVSWPDGDLSAQGVIAVPSDGSAAIADSPMDQDKIPDAVDAAVEAGTYPKLVSDELFERLVQAYAVATLEDAIRLFPETYNEHTQLDSFIFEARRNLTASLQDLEYAHAALEMQKDRG